MFSPAALTAQTFSIGFSSGHAAVRANFDLASRASGRWVVQRERVWIPECRHIVQVPARWGYRQDSCGRRVRVLIAPAYQRIVVEPGRWEWQTRRVWVPATRGHRGRPIRHYR